MKLRKGKHINRIFVYQQEAFTRNKASQSIYSGCKIVVYVCSDLLICIQSSYLFDCTMRLLHSQT